MTSLESDIQAHLQWMAIHNYSPTTMSCRARYLAYFADFAHSLGVDASENVRIEHLLDYQAHLYTYRKSNGQPLGVSTQLQRLIPLNKFFSWLRFVGRIEVNPAADLVMPRPDRRLPEATLSAIEMNRLVNRPDVNKPMGLRDRAMLEVFYSCALRRSELIGLLVKDIDFDRGTVFIRCAKGFRDRYVPIGERALFWVRLYLGTVRPRFVGSSYPDHVFVASTGNPVCPDWLCRRVRNYLAECDIQKRGSCHLLRHSVATLMLEGGADIRYVAEMLGHSRLETTQLYTHVSIDRLRAVHAACHPASGLDVAMANEICHLVPASR